jgi:uncharacterized protein DUF6795
VNRWLPCLAALVASGCLPIPHYDWTSPRVTGVLTRHGEPVAGARVFVAMDASCITPVSETTTDRDGAFHIEQHEELKLYVRSPFTVEPEYSASVCLVTAEEGQSIGYADGGHGTPGRLVLRCELTTRANSHDLCWRLFRFEYER